LSSTSAGHRVTLTFDNGPTPGVTEGVLDHLGERDLRATFFVIGSKIADERSRVLAERAHRAGHWIGNHTFSHATPLGELRTTDDVDREIDETQALIGALAHPDLLFRPYGAGGVIDRRIIGRHGRQRLLDGGFTCCLWNCVPGDWVDPDGWVDTCLAMIAEVDWAIVVLHDLATGAMDHLPGFLDELVRRDVDVVQDFPDACTPIRRGAPTEWYSSLPV
jgi:peptidoglycan/xylan/chitin deacetylase (PgdA/CDA1 family)